MTQTFICIDCGYTVHHFVPGDKTIVRCLACAFILEHCDPEDEEKVRETLKLPRK